MPLPKNEADALANMLAADSRRVDALTQDMGEVKADVRVVRSGVDELRSALAVLVKHEVRMENQASDFAELRSQVIATDQRVQVIEHAMPQLIETRKWTMGAVLAVAGAVGVALLALVVNK